ncbi:polyhydroxyalkanoate synthesis regulator phasin [Streptomonospora nanhaiensis]|uniref:Polyhydroxyalkanoate synthesis regulator phasin n=1 Tax=Streptomonospora nanhaiensis TaxID=1323731 RepID=A0A853BK76_9ACTN|nr:hypothetical protein [Streptomonospora nanhaiensis]NYI95908.1 polyhydroxyalkanoate synthesis regulator phasin [Streptomonospora nanhaiensis]
MANADDQECVAEFVEGSLTVEECGCTECRDEEADLIDAAVEQGAITEEEARDRHLRNFLMWG